MAYNLLIIALRNNKLGGGKDMSVRDMFDLRGKNVVITGGSMDWEHR
jgi:hypothetical protein